MSKTKRIVYWVSTLWLSLGMLSTGIVQVLGLKEETAFVIQLGYPTYLLILLGVWKFLGVIAILLPRYPLLKEWAYAGFFFAMSGAMYSHIAAGTTSEIFGSSLLLVLTIVSWYTRPADRKLETTNLTTSL
jgi:uncharacterized membrane protein (UPF0182 family)